MNQFEASSFLSFTIAIMVFFAGVHTNRRVSFLRKYNIPEPVTGGIIAALLSLFLYQFLDMEIVYDLEIRDILLVYFFTGIGLNARLQDLMKGGKPLIIMLGLTISYIFLQNLIGIFGATLVGAPAPVGVLAGSASLIGGHGTAIAWAPEIANMGIDNSLEIGIASATIGLILASLIGGPIAHVLISRYKLEGDRSQVSTIGLTFDQEEQGQINHLNLMSVMLTLHATIIVGWLANQFVTSVGFKLPLFVTCLLVGIILSNLIPNIAPKLNWPARTKALAVVSDFSLGIFLSMSLMSMQLWSITQIAGLLSVILILQTVTAVLFILFVLFPLMGRNYQAAVLSSGFGGFALGATPTAIANMTAVTKSHGPAPLAFIILPLVAAFFVDIANSFIIKIALNF